MTRPWAWRLRSAAAVFLLLTFAGACGASDASAPGESPQPTPPAESSSTAPATQTASPRVTTKPTSSPSTTSTASAGPTRSGAPSAKASTAPPPATTPVPARTPGDITETVASRPQRTKKPVKIDETADSGTGLTAEITEIKAVTATANLPGEVQGPALAISLRLKNTGQERANLSAVVVTVADSAGNPGSEMSTKPARPFSGVLEPGETSRAVYLFTVPKDKRDPITLSVTLGGSVPVLIFTGKAA